jgi:hypothetical protein
MRDPSIRLADANGDQRPAGDAFLPVAHGARYAILA